MLLLSDFDYDLPAELIAQRPPTERDGGRLMRLERASGAVSHHAIRDLPQLLPPRSLLVVNDTRVVPARLGARRATGGKVEVMLLEPLPAEPGCWLAMVRASKRPRAGEQLVVGAGGEETIELERAVGQGRFEVRLPADAERFIERHGSVPLPPYIRRDPTPEDRQRYQTVYARLSGSVAAPTAGLHLSERLLAALDAAGIERTALTLHVGPGTFTPVRTDDVAAHQMESERVTVSDQAAADIARARAEGRRVVAVGTTCVRALEATRGQASEQRTDLFIRPGHTFAVVEGLLTNFHLPRSTLLMLVSAFAGREAVLAAYNHAVERRYRFYSYGDAMLIV